MTAGHIARQQAWDLVCKYTHGASLRKHMLAVEAALQAYARQFGEDEHLWGLVGLLHDFDYERWPNPPDHPLRGAQILAEQGYPDVLIYAIKSHADYLPDCPRLSRLDKTLYACDELAGFISAVALLRPTGIHGLEAASVQKKMKQKGFAASIRREDIVRGAEDLGVDLAQHIQFVIQALSPIADQLGLGAALPQLPPSRGLSGRIAGGSSRCANPRRVRNEPRPTIGKPANPTPSPARWPPSRRSDD